MDTVFSYKCAGLNFDIYPNKVEVVKGAFTAKNTTTIPISRIASVGTTFTGKLIIETTGSKKYEYPLGAKAKEAKSKIEELM